MSVRNKSIVGLVIALLFPLSCAAAQGEGADEAAFRTWLAALAVEATAQGIAPATVERVWPLLSLDEDVIALDRRQPEGTIAFAQYVRNTLPPSRIEKARALLEENRLLLKEAEAAYGVPPAVLVALWGMESSFGDNQGDEQTLSALASLAYEGRRASFFEKEFIEALRIVDEEGRDPSLLRGSWAGAMGQCQFMPSTYRRYAVDGDGDGRRDIWESLPDVFASMARYLGAEGWHPALGWGREVRATKALPADWIGPNASPRESKDWSRAGVRELSGLPLDARGGGAFRLLQPDGAKGRSFLITENALALMKWNRSTYFVAAVGLFINEIEAER